MINSEDKKRSGPNASVGGYCGTSALIHTEQS